MVRKGNKLKKCICSVLMTSVLVAQLPISIINTHENAYAETVTIDSSAYTYEVLDDGTVSTIRYNGSVLNWRFLLQLMVRVLQR